MIRFYRINITLSRSSIICVHRVMGCVGPFFKFTQSVSFYSIFGRNFHQFFLLSLLFSRFLLGDRCVVNQNSVLMHKMMKLMTSMSIAYGIEQIKIQSRCGMVCRASFELASYISRIVNDFEIKMWYKILFAFLCVQTMVMMTKILNRIYRTSQNTHQIAFIFVFILQTWRFSSFLLNYYIRCIFGVCYFWLTHKALHIT